MTQPPAVVIIARHGTRFDAAHASWHLSTPTPYDPPLTYAGWNHCRALGVRIGSLLHAREQSYNNAPVEADHGANGATSHKRKRKKHKVVIHTSPFLRCVQTSVAVAAGMAQYEAPRETLSRPGTGKARMPAQLHSASPRIRGVDGSVSPSLAPIAEPKHDFAHDLARRALGDLRRHRKAKLRVDPFLGEWLNPSYFEEITPPPPSAMMVTTAKAELMQNDAIDVFAPAISNKSSASSLWSGGGAGSRIPSRENTIDDWSDVIEALPVPAAKKDRASSMSSDASSGRKSPFRPGHALHPFTSTIPKPEPAVYHPPVPTYAVSASDHIPRGYEAHARNECVDVDFQWDSSREPLDWGDGGTYGEEWSSMQRRFRKGLNSMVEWYSHHDSDEEPGDDGTAVEAEKTHLEDDVEEDIVLIIVTHAAGCNALIGALTGQPVLLDVGMASLTMAVKRDDAPGLPSDALANRNRALSGSPDPLLLKGLRRHSVVMDIGLSTMYEMKLISSSEHLRSGTGDPARASGFLTPADSRLMRGRHAVHTRDGSGIESLSDRSEPTRNNTNTSLGSIRRPSLTNTGTISSAPVTRGPSPAISSLHITVPVGEHLALPSPTFSSGLWSPPSSRLTPQLGAQKLSDEQDTLFSQLSEEAGPQTPGRDLVLDFSNSPEDAQPSSFRSEERDQGSPFASLDGVVGTRKQDSVLDEADPNVFDSTTNRGQKSKGLWASRPGVDPIVRSVSRETKRRWTTNEEQQHQPQQ